MKKITQKIIMLFIIWNSYTLADIKINITHGINTAHPIAIMPFTWIQLDHNTPIAIENSNIKIASIIAADLSNSDKFNIFPVSNILNTPNKISDIIPMFWEKLGIHVIVLGSIKIDSNNNYTVRYQLVDTTNNPPLIILENQFSIKKEWIRYIAHVISNEIFEKLTGIQGVFCSRIAYVTHINNNTQYPYELCISDYDGFNQTSICKSSAPLMSPAWSPDGKKIAYVTFASGFSELVIQTLNTGIIDNTIKFPRHNGAPAFSPDGKKLAFALSKTGSLNLYIMDLASREIKQLTNNRWNNTEPSWFPDSNNLAYTSDHSGTPQIYKININTNKIQRLSWLNTNNQKPNVSTDGTFILMVNRNLGKQNIAKLDLLTNKEVTLTDTSIDDTPSIASNNTMMIYSTTQDSKSVIVLASIDGHCKKYLKKPNENIRFPAWSLCLK